MAEVNYQTIKQGIANLMLPVEPTQILDDRTRSFDTSLLIETTLAVVFAVLAIKLFSLDSTFRVSWLTIPGILIIIALIPSVIKRRDFPKFGFNIRCMKDSTVVLGWTCIVFLPLAFCGLWLLVFFGFELPLRSMLPQGKARIYWLFYQFTYIALAEEVFFRGYVQSNVLKLTNPVIGKLSRLQQWISILVSAALFAVFHIIVYGQIISALIFLPGLVLGWLFIRTRSLFAPILFHGLANICYVIMIAMLT